MIAVAAASGAMAAALPAFADSAADGSAAGSAGVVSGNTIQLPVHVPVNVCGNTVNVVGLLNPAAGNSCANEGGGAKSPAGPRGGASAHGDGKDAPGVVTGNGVQLPIRLPVNVTGNSVNVVGVANPVGGNRSVNTSGDHPQHPARPTPEPPAPTPVPPKPHPAPASEARRHPVPPAAAASLAHTGTDGTIPAAAASAALVLGGAALYRRFRPRAGR
ncbi:chaplin [Streptomyces sp. NPDC050549]|uniref:chaplin n=1 Tax=Streptomyces sp. NPDC050549 TaxID=3155406 RepID=UPI0034467C1C